VANNQVRLIAGLSQKAANLLDFRLFNDIQNPLSVEIPTGWPTMGVSYTDAWPEIQNIWERKFGSFLKPMVTLVDLPKVSILTLKQFLSAKELQQSSSKIVWSIIIEYRIIYSTVCLMLPRNVDSTTKSMA
jgi:hypothetical protein